MQTDETILLRIAPANPDDSFVVRHVDGGVRELERILNLLPDNWKLEHLAPARLDRLVIVLRVGSPLMLGDDDDDSQAIEQLDPALEAVN